MSDKTTPQDSAAMPPASDGSVLEKADGVIRGMALSHRIVGDKTGAAFMEYMADLLARLRLTDAEREAIAGCVSDDEAAGYYTRADTLRGLLERL